MNRILHVLQSMNSGGIESFLMNIYRTIDKENIQFDFLLFQQTNSEYESEILKLGGRLFFLKSRRKGYLQNKKQLNEFFKLHNEFNVVHMHVSCLSYVYPLIAAKKAKLKKRIIHSHSSVAPGSIFHLILHYINKIKISKIATDYFSCSDLSTEWLYSKTKIYNKVIFIPNGIDCNKFTFDGEARAHYRKLYSMNDKIVLVHVGRFSKEKNHNFLIDIFYDFQKKHNNAILVLVGSGNTMPDIKEKVRLLNLDKNVVFFGKRTDIKEILSMSDIYLLPSFYEGFPISLIEAQSVGVPCVYSDTITNSASIINNVKRVSIIRGTEMWARAIEDMLNLRREVKTDLLVKTAGFDIKDVTSYLEDFYIPKSGE